MTAVVSTHHRNEQSARAKLQITMMGIGAALLVARVGVGPWISTSDAVAAAGTLLLIAGAALILATFVWWVRTTPTPDAVTARARRVAWHQFTRRRRRSLMAAEAFGLIVAALAVPLYLQSAGYQWTLGAGKRVRELPPNIDTVLSWALWTAQAGAAFAGVLAIFAVSLHLLRHRSTPPAHWRHIPIAAVWMVFIGALWALSSITTTAVVVNALVMT